MSESAKAIVDTAALQSAAVGVIGGFVPLADMAGIGVIWSKLVYDLAKDSGRELDSEFAKKLALSVTGGAALYIGGSRLLGAILSWALPGVGTIPIAGINAILDYIYTNRFGAILYKEFQSPKITGELLLANVAGMVATIFAIPGISDITDAYGAVSEIIHGGLAHAHILAGAGDAAHAVTQAASLAADHATHLTTAADAVHHTLANAAPHFGGQTLIAAPVNFFGGILQAPPDVQAQAMHNLATALHAAPGQEHLASAAQAITDHFSHAGSIDVSKMQEVLNQVYREAPKLLKVAGVIRFGGGS